MLPTAPFLLERYYGQYEHQVARQLSASDCEALSVQALLDLAGQGPEVLLATPLGYTTARGAPALRRAIAEHYPNCDAEDVLVGGAPQECILLAMHALLSRGARVVVQHPCYQSLAEVAEAMGCQVVFWRAQPQGDGFSFDMDELRSLLAEPTALLVTNFPHNPTGVQLGAAAWQALASTVAQSGCRWFSDEMYRGLAPDEHSELPPAAGLVPSAISLWGLSKSFGLPGLRLGWLVCRDRELLRRIEQFKDWTSICSNALSETLGLLALSRAEAIFGANRRTIAENIGRMRSFVERHSEQIQWQAPRAGPISLARVRQGTASQLAERVRTRGSALLVPSHLFGLDDHWVRVGLGRTDFADALSRWEFAGVSASLGT